MEHDAALELSDLKFGYTAGTLVVDIARLSIARGEQVLLTGGSGSGKSTLLQLICGLLDPGQGSVVVAGARLDALRGAARDLYRGRHIGMIFQSFNLLTGFSAAENVMAALMFSTIRAREHQGRAVEALKGLGIETPERLVDELSVGQQQRVAVARAVACDPALVLADEPTASLDPENAAIAMDLIQGVCKAKGAALLCVSHDPAMAVRFERRHALAELNRAGKR